MKEVKIPYIVRWCKMIPFRKRVPWIKRQKIELQKKKFVLVNEISKIPEEQRKDYILLFYADEKHFNAFYTKLDEKRLKKYKGSTQFAALTTLHIRIWTMMKIVLQSKGIDGFVSIVNKKIYFAYTM